MLGDDAQNNDTNAKYTDDITTGISVNLLPWKRKKTGRKKRKNGPDIPASEYSKVGGGTSRLTEHGVRQDLDNQVDVEGVEDESGFAARLKTVFHPSSSLGTNNN